MTNLTQRLTRGFAAALLVAGLAACTGTTSLAPGLTARMDAPGARIDRAEALGLINQYRISRGAPPLVQSAALNTSAQALAAAYAANGERPQKPETAAQMRVSAGYADFAETFSGWRNNPADADALADPEVQMAGLGVAYTANSNFGVHWVLLLGRTQ